MIYKTKCNNQTVQIGEEDNTIDVKVSSVTFEEIKSIVRSVHYMIQHVNPHYFNSVINPQYAEKIGIIKIVQEAYHLGLKQCKILVEAAQEIVWSEHNQLD
jgi:ribosomal protein L7/L12